LHAPSPRRSLSKPRPKLLIRAPTRVPARTTDIAELCFAAACHMQAALVVLDEGVAAVATAPA